MYLIIISETPCLFIVQHQLQIKGLGFEIVCAIEKMSKLLKFVLKRNLKKRKKLNTNPRPIRQYSKTQFKIIGYIPTTNIMIKNCSYMDCYNS